MPLRRAWNLIRVACHGTAGLSALVFTAAVVAAGCSETTSIAGPNPVPTSSGSGFPLLLIAGGGLNSTMSGLHRGDPFNPIEEFKGEYRCIASDLRNANGGQSSGPLEIDRPWDAYTDDQLGVMDHLGIDKFMVMGFCIGGPFIWNLLERAPVMYPWKEPKERIPLAVRHIRSFLRSHRPASA
jgi:pimeloyl-ACP methyl ester carboxylesterase